MTAPEAAGAADCATVYKPVTGAILSVDRAYRYALWRRWGEGPWVTWIMLNPSTADEDVDDPTIRRCTGFTKAWGYGGFTVVNLYALRSTDPKALLDHPDPIGSGNGYHLSVAIRQGALNIAAWGAGAGGLPYVDIIRLAKAEDRQLHCLGTTKAGFPRHPLYVRGDTAPTPWPPPSASLKVEE